MNALISPFTDITTFEYLQQFSEGNDKGFVDKGMLRFSYWTYSLFTNCPHQFKRVVFDHVKLEENKRPALEGSVIHKVCEDTIRAGEALETVHDKVLKEFTDFTTKEPIIWTTKDIAKEKEVSLQNIHDWLDYTVKFLGNIDFSVWKPRCEQPFKVLVHPAMFITGRVDLILEHIYEKVFYVIDYKAVKSERTLDFTQLHFYDIGIMAQYHLPVKGATFLLMQLKSFRGVEFSEAQRKLFLNKIFMLAVNFDMCMKSKNWPKNQTSKGCSYCGIKYECGVPLKLCRPEGQLEF